MKILNIVIPILMRFYSLVSNWRGASRITTKGKVIDDVRLFPLLGIIFLNTELNKLHFLRNEMIFMHCLLQIKQNIYIFLANVVTQFIVKV